jgi:predicted ATPase/class 3 adenylate cyclase
MNLRTNDHESTSGTTSALPAGTVTFLLTDIEDSTRLWQQHPQQMSAVMVRHDALVESHVSQNSGLVVKPRGEGDSRFAVFSRPSAAVATARAIQHAFAIEPWSLSAPLRVRIALHTGEAELRDGDYYGTAVNRCARLRAMAHGGQTLVSTATATLLRDEPIEGLHLRDLGQYRLNGLEGSERIYQVVTSDLPDQFPPLRSQEDSQGNLPLVLTSFIGREREISEIKQLVSSCRLLTILGVGGSGKTRLSLRVAAELTGHFTHGIWFVDLAPLSNPSLAIQALYSTLPVREEEGMPLLQTITSYLRHKEMLLILDNCEHLLPGVSHFVEAILLGAPQVKILTTSREALGISGETVWWIPSLTFPPPGSQLEHADVVKYEAVQLFLSRAKAVKPDFVLNGENALAVTQICAHLDGLPLAIELAAARTKVLAAQEIAARLGDRFRLLVGSRTALMRQQTLQALIDWSYDLLTEQEQTLLQRLSLFAGGCTLQAIEDVCSGGSVKAGDVLDLVSRLVDKSLVIAQPQGTHIRYHFLETIQQYSQARLSESGKSTGLRRKHAHHFLKMAEASYGQLWGPKQAYWLAQLEAEYDNLRQALEWTAARATRKEMYLRLTRSLWRFWSIRGYFSEGRAWLAAALARYPDAPPAMLAHALRGAGILAAQQGDYLQAKLLHEQSLALFQQIDDRLGTARQLTVLGEIAWVQGDYALSLELTEASLVQMRAVGDREGIAVVLGQMGVLARDRGQNEQARELLNESLKLSREQEDKQMTALALKYLGVVEYCLGEYQRALDLFEAALTLYRELKDKLGISNVLQQMAYVAKERGEFKRSTRLFRECLDLKQELGERLGIAYALANLAEIAIYQGRYPMVVELTEQSTKLFQELGAKRGIVFSLGLRGYAAHYQGQYETALDLARKCLALATEIGAPRLAAYGKELMGLVAYVDGDLEKARNLLLEALGNFREVGDRRSMAVTWINLARVAYRQGDHECALSFLNESVSLSRKLDISWTTGFALEILGLLERSQGNYERATRLFQESLQLAVEQDNQQGIANCLGALAGLAALTKKPACAATLFGAAHNTREAIGARMGSGDRAEYENYLALVRQQIGEAEFEATWRRGAAMTAEQAADECSASLFGQRQGHYLAWRRPRGL